MVYKPAGVHTKPGGMRAARTLKAALPAVLAAPAGRADVLCVPTAVHRLDCRVAGCLVVVKASGAAAFLSEEFASAASPSSTVGSASGGRATWRRARRWT